MPKDRMKSLIARKYQKFSFCEKDIDLQKVMNCVYFISDGKYTKIGMARFLCNRLAELQTSNSRKLIPLCACVLNDKREMQKYENKFHKYFSNRNVRGEWFYITEDDIKNAKEDIGVEMYRVIM